MSTHNSHNPFTGVQLSQLGAFSDWSELRDLLRDDYRGWLFRGVASSDWHLEPSIERLAEASVRAETEIRLCGRFRQAANNYLPAQQLPSTFFDCLAAMQHHGAPTRLLDFTRSPYVAAYFAIEDVRPETACRIWAINEKAIHDRANAIAATHVEGDAPLARWLYASQMQPIFPCVAPAGLHQMSARQIAQQSVFLLPGDPAQSFHDNLFAMYPSKVELGEDVAFFDVPATWRSEIMRDLKLMNITRASLFPGLDGFAQSLRHEVDDEPMIESLSRARTRFFRLLGMPFDDQDEPPVPTLEPEGA